MFKKLADIRRSNSYCRSMNIEQAKRILIEELLLRLGFVPSRKGHDQLWYLSPLRNESTASFKVNTALNAWYDFGIGEGGDVVDLVKRLDHLPTISSALTRLDELIGSAPLPVRELTKSIEPSNSPALELTSLGPVHAKSLTMYLRSRRIDPARVSSLVQEAHYRKGDDSYYALAFRNDSNGFELRNPFFKGTLGSKDITTLPGDPARVVVFEGFFDYLTSVMMNGSSDATVIILNSVSMREKACEAIRHLRPKTVELFRDHDEAGEDLLNYFRSSLPNVDVVDKSDLYPGFSDLNEWYAARTLRMHG